MRRIPSPRNPSATAGAGALPATAAVALAFVLLTVGLLPAAAQPTPQPVPDVVNGFVLTPLAEVPPQGGLLGAVDLVTAVQFGPEPEVSIPETDEAPDLYATMLGGRVVRVDLVWTAAGPVAHGVTTVADGFNFPLGLAFDPDPATPVLYVADSHRGPDNGRTDGYVARLEPFAGDDSAADATIVVDGLPNGRHNTNHLRFGPDGRLYIANGNPNDNGVQGGAADVLPLSGAILSVDADEVSQDPAVLEWRDAEGDLIPPDEVASHPVNDDFNAKVEVVASGFRNVFGVAFGPDGTAYTAENGADAPSSQDGLYRVAPADRGTDYGFPFCYNEGPPGGVGAAVRKTNNPLFPDHDCSAAAHPPADALLGWHVCATGLDLPTAGPWAFPAPFDGDVYVGECFVIFAQDWVEQVLDDGLEDPGTVQHSVSHKVARVVLDDQGRPTEVRDFVTGLAAPTDVRFGPEGAMYVADGLTIYRVAPAVNAAPLG